MTRGGEWLKSKDCNLTAKHLCLAFSWVRLDIYIWNTLFFLKLTGYVLSQLNYFRDGKFSNLLLF